VNENDDLHAAIWAELKGWVSPTKGDMR